MGRGRAGKNVQIDPEEPRIVGLTASLGQGNTGILSGRALDAVERGVGFRATLLLVAHKRPSGCAGCRGCRREKSYCVIQNDWRELVWHLANPVSDGLYIKPEQRGSGWATLRDSAAVFLRVLLNPGSGSISELPVEIPRHGITLREFASRVAGVNDLFPGWERATFILVNGRSIWALAGLDTLLKDGDRISVLRPISGG